MAALEPEFHAGLDEKAARALLYRLKDDAYRDRLLLAWSRAGDNAQYGRWEKLFTLADRWQPPPFPLKGKDLIAAGMEPGAGLGQLLSELEEHWIASDFTLSREELLQAAG